MIPGSNLLNMASQLIARQPFMLYRYIGREYGAAGELVIQYDDPVTLLGMVQPVPRSVFEKMGLNMSRNYITVHVPSDAIGLQRDSSGDYIRWGSKWWTVESRTDWFDVDGWQELLCIQTDTAPNVPGPYYG